MPAPDSRKVMDVVSSEKNLMKTRRWISRTRFFTQCRFLEPMAWHHIRTWMFSVSWRRLGNTRQDLIQPLWSSIVRSGVLVLPDLTEPWYKLSWCFERLNSRVEWWTVLDYGGREWGHCQATCSIFVFLTECDSPKWLVPSFLLRLQDICRVGAAFILSCR